MPIGVNSSSLTYTLICSYGRGTTTLNITVEITRAFSAQIQLCSLITFFSCLPAALLNILAIIAIAKTKELQTPSNVLVFSLSVTDAITGAICFPMYGVYLHNQRKMQNACLFTYIVYQISAPLSVISIISVSTIALERYLALFSPYFYQHHVTTRKIVIGISVVWVAVILIFLISFGIGNTTLALAFTSITIIVGLSWNAYVYVKIFKLLRRLQRQTWAENIPASITTENKRNKQASAEKRLNTFTGVIILVLFFSYMPFLCTRIVTAIHKLDNNAKQLAETYSRVTLLLNSLMNPIVYFKFHQSGEL